MVVEIIVPYKSTFVHFDYERINNSQWIGIAWAPQYLLGWQSSGASKKESLRNAAYGLGSIINGQE